MKKLILAIVTIATTQVTIAQSNIQEARGMSTGTTVTITGVAMNGDDYNSNIRYIQDATAAIPAFGNAVQDVERGDSITVTGELKDYNGLLEVDKITNVTNHGKATVVFEPKVITPTQQGENIEGQLVQVNQVVFTDGGNTFQGNATAGYSSNGEQGVVYNRNGSKMVGRLIPVGEVTIVGLASQFSFTGDDGYQILIRDSADIIFPSAINIITSIEQSNTNTTGFDLTWQTDINGSTGVMYTTMKNPQPNDFTVVDNGGSTTEHSIQLTGLEAGNIYFTRVFSVKGSDTAMSSLLAYATQSNSTGKINVLFTQEADTSLANPKSNKAVWTNNIEDTLIKYIDAAKKTIDVAVYNNNSNAIVSALNRAYDRNVIVRYITEGQNANLAINSLKNEIGFISRQNATSSGMHNKFLVIDRDSTQGAIVITGSTNLTEGNMFDDYNNMVIIQDQALARAYTIEFEEMFGSAGATPIVSNSKFGGEKSKNTPEHFVLGNGAKVELYFSPTGGTTSAIADNLNAIDRNCYFALLVFTRDELADIMITKNNDFFSSVEGIIEQANSTGSEFEKLETNFVPVISHTGFTGELHHKYAIVDVNENTFDPVVMTGSHNWSSSAENSNDENMLVIHDANIANQYYQEYMMRKSELTSIFEYFKKSEKLNVFPNPSSTGKFKVETNGNKGTAYVFDSKGMTVKTIEVNGTDHLVNINLTGLSKGEYHLILKGKKTEYTTLIYR